MGKTSLLDKPFPTVQTVSKKVAVCGVFRVLSTFLEAMDGALGALQLG